MTQRIPWGRVLAEGAIIVVSILLAFGLDAWWDDRGERELARVELRQVGEELRQNRDQLDSRIRSLVMVEAMLTQFWEEITEAAPGAQIMVADTVLASLTFFPSHNPSTVAISRLLTSGRLADLEDAELRSELSQWPGLWDDVQERQAEQMATVMDRVLPYFVAQDLDIGRSIALTQPWLSGSADSIALSGSTEISVSGGLGSIMGERLRALRLLIRYLDDFRTFEARLVSMIEAAVG